MRFLGNELPDPSIGVSVWSDSVLQTLYDAIHAVALTTTGATSLMHEVKVDVVTVPNLSEHLSSAATTAQLSARFSYAAAMKSLNNLLLLGDGETWSRQKIDFSGLPEMVRTFLQVAAGAADIPVTRLLGQSPAGMSATGESDTRNYYDMISSRQEIDLRPKLERLDALLLRSAGVDPSALTFEFRPLWQMDAAASAAIALQKAQASQIYAGLNLWPAAVTAKLVEAQLAEDGTYPGAERIFAEATPASQPTADFDPDQPRDPDGRWTNGGASGAPVYPGASRTLISLSAVAEHASLFSHILNRLNAVGSGEAHEFNAEKESLGSSDPTRVFGNSLSSNTMLAQSGPLLPGGTIQEPLTGTDPLDPASLNTSAPSAEEQQALAATLNLIHSGTTLGLNPHTYQNRPDPSTGAVLPPSRLSDWGKFRKTTMDWSAPEARSSPPKSDDNGQRMPARGHFERMGGLYQAC